MHRLFTVTTLRYCENKIDGRARTGQGASIPAYKGMFSEGFAYYTHDLPALYLSLGIVGDGYGEAGVHVVDFKFIQTRRTTSSVCHCCLCKIGTGELQ